MSTAMTEAPFVVSHHYCAIRGNTVEELVNNLRAFNANDDISEEIAAFRSIVTGNEMSNAVGTVKAAMPGTTTVSTSGPEEVADKNGNGTWTYNHPDAREISPGITEALHSWTDKNGKPRKAFKDPMRGPKPCSPGDRDRDYVRWV